MKKVLSVFLAVLMLFAGVLSCGAADVSRVDEYKALFKGAQGPEVGGVITDYMYFTPADLSGGVKYPLVVFFHGMGQGGYPGAQIESNNMALWASEELQSRFTNGGAFLMMMRTHEEKGEYWENNAVPSVKAAVDEFIALYGENIDLSRIYVGGFSMGGKMTLKMATSYPDFFAAAFPMCPAYKPSAEQFAAIADMPVWLVVSRYDVIAGYFTDSEYVWNNLKKATVVPEDCRLSLFTTVHFPDGKKTDSNHHVWFAAANDLFMYDGGDYDNMTTIDAAGNELTLEYPDGLISWMCSYTSDYTGGETNYTGLCEKNEENLGMMALDILKAVFMVVFDFFRNLLLFGEC